MDWIAAAFVIFSVYLTGRKNRWGWVVAGIGAILFMIVAFQKEVYGMIALDVVLIIMNIINFIKWSGYTRPFRIKLNNNPFKKGDIIKLDSSGQSLIVLKVLPNNELKVRNYATSTRN
jgi:nicotinamide riboside transporter PnuC